MMNEYKKLSTLLAPMLGAVSRIPTTDTIAEQLATLTTGYTPDAEREAQEKSYFEYPLLKAPFWKWEIVWYFFMGGLAAGCYILASIASLFGSKEDRSVVRVGYYLSFLALLPCPPLLIKDLGRPERFLNMLRIFKIRSPMSQGVWGLLTFSMFCGFTAVSQAASDGLLGRWWGARVLAAIPRKVLAVPGTFFGMFLGGYTGLLLAATSIPLWSRSKLMGAIFISSAVSTSSALISLVLRLVDTPASTLHKMERMEWSAMLLELVGLLAFLRGSGRAARSLVGTGPNEHGMSFWRFMFGGLILPWLLQTFLLVSKRSEKRLSMAGLAVSVLVLIGGYFLRHDMIEAGRSSSRDTRTTLWNARR
ncbi:MAG: polysulfide reductase NrfD [Ktedonobacteraceae bacterium]